MATWMTSNPIHNTFASLCVRNGDTLTVNEDCLAILEDILLKLAAEDCTLRTFRRAICFGQNIRKDLLPLLLYVKDDSKITDATKIIDKIIKILVNLTIPVEYLLPIQTMTRTDVEKHTIFELNRLLTTSKEAFTDSRSTKAVVDHIKYFVEKDTQLDLEQCDSINNCLLLLRNILHIPETKSPISYCSITNSSMQNQIIWNLFTQSIDKVIIYLMSCPQKMYWGVTMVQLIALIYKDQHVGTLQKLLNLWLETSVSESSDDNESNTSPPDQGSGDSSPVITSDPTSDSSDTGGSDRNKNTNNNLTKTTIINSDRNKNNTADVVRAVQNRSKVLAEMKRVKSTETEASNSSSSGVSSAGQSMEIMHSLEHSPTPQSDIGTNVNNNNSNNSKKRECPSSQSEISDCGYVTQVENQESISTSSNDDDQPHQKPIHQKPHTFQKSRYTSGKNRATSVLEKKELRRKKLVKRSKTNTIQMKGLMHHLPTDEEVANILKEFTVDFLLKGYGTLVQDLHSQLLANIHIHIDTSHFFWLVTYFLKFATQLELDLEHVSSVLSYEVLSYLIFQGIWVYEELELLCRISDVDLKPCLRRLHLIVTAIREFLQGIESYQKMIHLSDDDRKYLQKLQVQISQTEDLRSLFVLLLRQYNPIIQSKQYLQDLILTNHNYLLFLDSTSKIFLTQFSIMEHLKQFATVEIMRQYGLLLENFKINGEFVNNCIFTMMHHIGGDLKHVSTLFQPSILKTFSQIWETDYEICDDWADLIEYVIHKFINTPRPSETPVSLDNTENVQEVHEYSPSVRSAIDGDSEYSSLHEIIILFRWTKEEKEKLLYYYNESRGSQDAIANITKMYEENGIRNKTQLSIIRELLEQNIINENQYKDFTRVKRPMEQGSSDKEKNDVDAETKALETLNCEDDLVDGDIKVLKEYFFKENKGKLILWLQKVLLEACYAKLVLANPNDFKDNPNIMVPTVYYFALLNLPIPLVPWTTEQTNILKQQPFVLLLHKLGFYLPVDTGKIFVRIPNFWNADYIFSIAQQLGPIDPAKLKFDISKLKGYSEKQSAAVESNSTVTYSESGRFSMNDFKQTPSMVRYTPLPNSTEWCTTILQSKITPVMDAALQILSTNQLSIAIPETETIAMPAPELCLAINPNNNGKHSSTMDCSPMDEQQCNHMLNDDIERNSICDTASVASDLTRMCVSDEEDKLILVVSDNKKK